MMSTENDICRGGRGQSVLQSVSQSVTLEKSGRRTDLYFSVKRVKIGEKKIKSPTSQFCPPLADAAKGPSESKLEIEWHSVLSTNFPSCP